MESVVENAHTGQGALLKIRRQMQDHFNVNGAFQAIMRINLLIAVATITYTVLGWLHS